MLCSKQRLPGARIGILGLGPIGRTVMLAALDVGCGSVYAPDLIDARGAAAQDAGTVWVGNPSRKTSSLKY